MRRLRDALLIAGLLLNFSASLAYAFGPLWVGNASVAPGCSPPFPLSRLVRHFSVGQISNIGAAAAMNAQGIPWDMRYQYFNGSNGGGCFVGAGWQSYASPNGQAATNYVIESQTYNMETMIVYYVAQADANYGTNVIPWLNNPTNSKCYFNDFTLLLQKLAAGDNGGAAVVIALEPDMWGFGEGASTGDNPATVPMAIASSGYTAPNGSHPLAGLSNTLIGLAQAYVAIRTAVAITTPGAANIILAYMPSLWSTPGGFFPCCGSGTQAMNTTAGTQAAAFYNKLNTTMDISTIETSDMTPGFFYGTPGGHANCTTSSPGLRGWWLPADLSNYHYALSAFSSTSGLKMIMWQMPSGNTLFLGQDNSKSWHYQSNFLQYFIQPGNPNLAPFIAAGALGLAISSGQQWPAINTAVCPGAATHMQSDTDITDLSGEAAPYNPGPTAINPAAYGIFPGNGTATFKTSTVTDDDGGYARTYVAGYYSGGPLAVCP